MMQFPLIVAQQTLDFIEVAREGLYELYLFLMRTVRDGRFAWVFIIVLLILIYQRFFKK